MVEFAKKNNNNCTLSFRCVFCSLALLFIKSAKKCGKLEKLYNSLTNKLHFLAFSWFFQLFNDLFNTSIIIYTPPYLSKASNIFILGMNYTSFYSPILFIKV